MGPAQENKNLEARKHFFGAFCLHVASRVRDAMYSRLLKNHQINSKINVHSFVKKSFHPSLFQNKSENKKAYPKTKDKREKSRCKNRKRNKIPVIY